MQSKLYFIIAIFVIAISPAFAQDPERIITVNYEDQTLEAILNSMEKEFGLKFSYLPATIPLDTIISIEFTGQSLETLLSILFKKVGVEYIVVKDHIALYHLPPRPIETEHPFDSTTQTQANPEASIPKPDNTAQETEQMIVDTLPHEIRYARLAGISNMHLIEQQNNLLTLPYDSSRKRSVPLSELSRKKLLSFGLIISAGLYHLSGKADENKNFTYEPGVNYGAGLSAGLKVKERWGIVLQFLYSTKNFDLYYNFQTVDEGDPFIPEKTVYQQAYMDLPLLLDYQVLEKGDWKLFGEVGFVPGFLLNSEKQTFHKDGSEMETPEFLEMKIRPQLFGAQLDIMAEREIGKYFSLTLSTGWRQYFNGINKEDLPTQFGLFQGTAGIRYTL